MKAFRREPAAVIGAAVGLVEALWALIAVLYAFDPELIAAGAGVIAAVGGFLTRAFVSPAPPKGRR